MNNLNDVELIDLAAKAIGLKDWYEIGWSPLTDDRDAFRLAVRLGLNIGPDKDAAFECVVARWGWNNCVSEHSQDNPYAATRRAIVRAAAEIAIEDKE